MNFSITQYTPEAVAENLIQGLQSAVKSRGKAVLGVPGGRSPGPVIRTLAGQLDAEILQALTLTWIDERWVPLNHSHRNDLHILKAWLEGGALPEVILPLPGIALEEESTQSTQAKKMPEAPGPKYAYQANEIGLAREEFEAYLLTTYGRNNSFELDVALIGIGEDGHLASLFPSHPSLDATGTLIVCSDSPKPPTQRLSLSMSCIQRARVKSILVLGEEKGNILAQAAKGPDPSLPVSLILESATCFLDSEALEAYQQGSLLS